MPQWDDSKPRGSIPISLLDNDTRDNFSAVKDAIGREHDFPGTFGTTSGVHSAGSSRIHVNVDTSGNRNAASNTLASSTGKLFYGSDTGRFYICTDGLNNTWSQITAATALTLSGALTANGGITLAAGQKLIVPTETYLRQGAIDINPHSHQARHTDMLTVGTDGVDYDFISYLPRSFTRMVTNSDLAGSGAPPVFIDDGAGVTLNFTGRRPASTVWLFAYVNFKGSPGVTGAVDITADGVPLVNTTTYMPCDDAYNSAASAMIMEQQTGLSAGSHTWRLRHVSGVMGGTWKNRQLVVIDMGPSA